MHERPHEEFEYGNLILILGTCSTAPVKWISVLKGSMADQSELRALVPIVTTGMLGKAAQFLLGGKGLI